MPDAEKSNSFIKALPAVRDLRALEPEGEVLFNIQVREEARLLKHIAETAFIGRAEDALFVVLPDFISDPHESLGSLKPRDAPQNGCLPAARGSEKHRNPFARNLDVRFKREARAAGKMKSHFAEMFLCHAAHPSRQASAVLLLRRLSVMRTMKLKMSMPPASTCAFEYSIAST